MTNDRINKIEELVDKLKKLRRDRKYLYNIVFTSAELQVKCKATPLYVLDRILLSLITAPKLLTIKVINRKIDKTLLKFKALYYENK